MWQQFWDHVKRYPSAFACGYLVVCFPVVLWVMNTITGLWRIPLALLLLIPPLYYEFWVAKRTDSLFGRWLARRRGEDVPPAPLGLFGLSNRKRIEREEDRNAEE